MQQLTTLFNTTSDRVVNYLTTTTENVLNHPSSLSSWRKALPLVLGTGFLAGTLYHRLTINSLHSRTETLYRKDGQEFIVDDKGHTVFLRQIQTGNIVKLDDGSELVIVLVHGMGCNSLEWCSVIPEASKATEVVTVDRIFFCKPGPNKKADNMAEELHTALHKLHAGRKIKYMIVGHSYGGMVAMMYNTLYPKETTGLVLIDPAHPDMYERWPRDMYYAFCVIPANFKLLKFLSFFGSNRLSTALGLGMPFPPTKLFPKKEADECAILMTSSSWQVALNEYHGYNSFYKHFKTNMATIKHAQNHVPMVVLTATNRIYGPSFNGKGVSDAFKTLHAEYLGEKSQHVLADQSDHWIHVQQPELILNAINYVLQNQK